MLILLFFCALILFLTNSLVSIASGRFTNCSTARSVKGAIRTAGEKNPATAVAIPAVTLTTWPYSVPELSTRILLSLTSKRLSAQPSLNCGRFVPSSPNCHVPGCSDSNLKMQTLTDLPLAVPAPFSFRRDPGELNKSSTRKIEDVQSIENCSPSGVSDAVGGCNDDITKIVAVYEVEFALWCVNKKRATAIIWLDLLADGRGDSDAPSFSVLVDIPRSSSQSR